MSFCRIDDKSIRTHEPVTEPDALERFLGDEALRKGWQVPVDAAPTGKRVLVVGAGPSSLSVAYHLARLGHWVTIKDVGPAASTPSCAAPAPGGGQARARLVRCPEYLVLRGRPGHRPAPARGGPADHHLRRGDRRAGRVDRAVRGAPLHVLRQLLRLPDNAVIKLGTGEYQYEIDYDYCKGCGLCVAECPCGAIEMEPEPS